MVWGTSHVILQAKLEASEHAKHVPIAIVGTGCRYPGGVETPEALWALVRDGVELPANFVATVNADLKVGTLQETVTVSGAVASTDAICANRPFWALVEFSAIARSSENFTSVESKSVPSWNFTPVWSLKT